MIVPRVRAPFEPFAPRKFLYSLQVEDWISLRPLKRSLMLRRINAEIQMTLVTPAGTEHPDRLIQVTAVRAAHLLEEREDARQLLRFDGALEYRDEDRFVGLHTGR